jgi:hypothetical protein
VQRFGFCLGFDRSRLLLFDEFNLNTYFDLVADEPATSFKCNVPV